MPGAEVIQEQEEWEERIESCPRSLPEQRALLEQLMRLYHPRPHLEDLRTCGNQEASLVMRKRGTFQSALEWLHSSCIALRLGPKR